MKKIDEGGYVEFLYGYFPKNFPNLYAKFPTQIDWSLIEAPYCTRKPSNMDTVTFDEFRLIEHEWLIKNGYIIEYAGQPSFAIVISGVQDINFSEVRNIQKLTENSTTIITRNSNGEENAYDVIGNEEYVYRKFGVVTVDI